jgi:hypothetical protein
VLKTPLITPFHSVGAQGVLLRISDHREHPFRFIVNTDFA